MMQKRLLKTTIIFIFLLINLAVFGQSKNEKLQFESFEVERMRDRVDVKWTVNEGEIDGHFEVERSFDGRKFKTIMYVLGSDPATEESGNYGSFDKFSTKFKLYYRLKQVNNSGEIAFSDIKSPAINQ